MQLDTTGKEFFLATDYGQLTRNLHEFYAFSNKVVLFVGAGKKQLFDPAIKTKRLIIIDLDSEALNYLKMDIALRGLNDAVDVISTKFEHVRSSGDVVYFEFCLHEMADPLRALTHAKNLARDVIVFDHLPGSDWSFYAAEEGNVQRSAAAIEHFYVRRRECYRTEQHFNSQAELLSKVNVQGPVAIERANRFAGVTNIVIEMSYGLVLL